MAGVLLATKNIFQPFKFGSLRCFYFLTKEHFSS